MNRPVVRVVIGIVLGGVLVLAAGGAFLWWKISTIKERLVHNLGEAIGAQVEISSLDLDPWKGELHAAGISLTNLRPGAPWDSGSISQATVHFTLQDLFSPTLPVTVEVSSWNIVLHSPATGVASPPSRMGAGSPDAFSASPPAKGRVQVRQITANEGSVEFDLAGNKKVNATGVSFQSADNGGGVWNTQLQAATISTGTLQAGPLSAHIRGDSDKVSFSDLRLECESGAITGDGTVSLAEPHDADVNLKAIDVPMSMLVAVAWQMKLSGEASGDLHYIGNDQGADAKGSLSVNHGKFNVLPFLSQVTTLVGLQDISNVEVDKATSDFEWKDQTLHLTNLDVRKNDVTRIAGNVDIDPAGQVDGRLKLGLPSAVTSKWPQVQTAVFPVAMDNYNWADVHVTGTPDHLQEDLSPRLVAAGVSSGVNQSSDLINQATQKASDLINSFLGK